MMRRKPKTTMLRRTTVGMKSNALWAMYRYIILQRPPWD
jgi:hypothetical protein